MAMAGRCRLLFLYLTAVTITLSVTFLIIASSYKKWEESPLTAEEESPSRRQLLEQEATKDNAWFKGAPVSLKSGHPPSSSVHCLGDISSANSNAHKWRSCQFRNLCFDTVQKEFVYHRSASEQELYQTIVSSPLVSISTVAQPEAMQMFLGVIQHDHHHHQLPTPVEQKSSWFPRVVAATDTATERDYYQLADTHVMIPFHLSPHWSSRDFIALFALLYTFGREGTKRVVLVDVDSRQQLGGDSLEKCAAECQQRLDHLLQGVRAGTLQQQGQTNIHKGAPLVCATVAVAGLGELVSTDKPYRTSPDGPWMNTHTIGRQPLLEAYNAFVHRNLERSSHLSKNG